MRQACRVALRVYLLVGKYTGQRLLGFNSQREWLTENMAAVVRPDELPYRIESSGFTFVDEVDRDSTVE
jgi:hypothetical protein